MSNSQRIDEVEKYYNPVSNLDSITTYLFWSAAIISLLIPYSNEVLKPTARSVLIASFITLVFIHFVLSELLRFYYIPRAEQARRKQLLTNAFNTPLSHDKTSLYYNNSFSPSLGRLAANIMENAYFTKAIASKMLIKKRLVIGVYLITLIFIFVLRHDNLNVLIWITQIVFSGEILAGWIKLEVLRKSSEDVYNNLHVHFLNGINKNSKVAIANILDNFANYESAKAASRVKLSSKIFKNINTELSKKWNRIATELDMQD